MNIFKYTVLALLPFAVALMLNGCSSNGGYDIGHGGNAGNGAKYGSGPNNTRPYPQDKPVNLNGVGGAKIKYEPLSRGGNKNYTVLGKNYQVWRDCTSYQEVGMASWYGPGFHGNKTSNGERYNQKGFSAAHKNLPLPSYLKVTNLQNGKAVVVRVNDRGPFHGSRIIDLSEGAARAIDMTRSGTAKVMLEYINVRKGGVIANKSDSIFSGQSSSGKDSIAQVIEDIKNGNKPSLGTTIGAIGTTVAIIDKVSSMSNQSSKSKKISGSALVSSQHHAAPAPAPAPSNSAATSGADSIENALFADNQTATAGTAYIQIFSTNMQDNATRVQQKLSGITPYPVIIAAENGIYRVRIGPVPESRLNETLNTVKAHGFTDSFVKRV